MTVTENASGRINGKHCYKRKGGFMSRRRKNLLIRFQSATGSTPADPGNI